MDELDAAGCRRFAKQLTAEGVSLWVAGLDRAALADGSFAELVAEGLLTGATCDAAPPADVLARPDSPYREQLDQLAGRGVTGPAALAALTAYDVRWACDELSGVYEASGGRDGLVGVRLAEPGRAAEAQLRAAVGRPGLLIGIETGSRAGLALLTDCLARGVGVQALGVSALDGYLAVLDAWILGLRRAAEQGLDLARISSVATVPLGSVERTAGRAAAGKLARRLYQTYEQRLGEADWGALADAGARPQRLMWTELAEPGQVAEYLAWNTVSAPALVTLREAVAGVELAGDMLGGAAPAGDRSSRSPVPGPHREG